MLLIENKLDSRLKGPQLDAYSQRGVGRLPEVVALVRHWPTDRKVPRNYRVYRWPDLYACLDRAQTRGLSETERFLLSNFLKYLEELGMDRVLHISKRDLSELAKGMDGLRTDKSERLPLLSLARSNMFETASKFSRVLKDLVYRARQDELFLESVGRDFRPKPRVLSMCDDPDVEDPVFHTWINVLVTLDRVRRSRVGEIKYIGAGLTLRDGDYDLHAYWMDRNEWLERAFYRKTAKGLDADDFISFCLKQWGHWLRSGSANS